MNWKLIAAVIVGLITGVLLYFWTESVKNEQVAYAFMRLQPDRKVTRGQAITPDMTQQAQATLPESLRLYAEAAPGTVMSEEIDQTLKDVALGTGMAK